MQFSLVLPTYRVAEYITACLESCCNQNGISVCDYEIIVVNDETPDNSIEIAQSVLARYPEHRWKIVNRKNGGLSAARNSGLQAASGDYVWFIDSDDFIEPESLSILSEAIGKGDFDVINFTHKTLYKDNRVVGGDQPFEGYSLSGVEYLAKSKFLSACTCIYKREFLLKNGLRFKEGVIWEDSEFNTRVYMLAAHCYCIGNALYNYIRRENSISDLKASVHSTHSRISNAFDLDTYFRAKGYTSNELGIAYESIASMLISALAGLPELDTEEQRHFRRLIRSNMNQYFRIFCRCRALRSKLVLLCFLVAPAFTEHLLNQMFHKAIQRAMN